MREENAGVYKVERLLISFPPGHLFPSPLSLKNCLIFYPIEYKYRINMVRVVQNSVEVVKYYLFEMSKV